MFSVFALGNPQEIVYIPIEYLIALLINNIINICLFSSVDDEKIKKSFIYFQYGKKIHLKFQL